MRVLLVHWNAAEAKERARRLAALGHRVRVHADTATVTTLRDALEAGVDAFVVDLARLPSHGRGVATALRERKSTRHLPLVFLEGDPAKTARARETFPDATFATWETVGAALDRAAASPVRDPIVPRSSSGYAGTPLPKKLGIGPESAVVLLGAPTGFEQTLGPLPDGVRVSNRARARAGTAVVLLFVRSRADFERRFEAAAATAGAGGRLWIVWPKKTSGVKTDLSGNDVRALGLARGWVDYKVAAIDATWSGFCFARRR